MLEPTIIAMRDELIRLSQQGIVDRLDDTDFEIEATGFIATVEQDHIFFLDKEFRAGDDFFGAILEHIEEFHSLFGTDYKAKGLSKDALQLLATNGAVQCPTT